MKAPSEKHLEDWIVANPKLFGDLWPTEEITGKIWDECAHLDNGQSVIPFVGPIIARQVRFPFGIADLVLANRQQVVVVEIKKDAVTAKTITQCLRYVHELKWVFSEVYWQIAQQPDDVRREYYYRNVRPLEPMSFPEDEVCGLVVGNSIESEEIVLLGNAAGIMVATYDYDPDSDFYTFERHEFYPDKQSSQIYRDFAHGAIGEAMRGVMRARHNWQVNRDRLFNSVGGDDE